MSGAVVVVDLLLMMDRSQRRHPRCPGRSIRMPSARLMTTRRIRLLQRAGEGARSQLLSRRHRDGPTYLRYLDYLHILGR